MAPRSGSGHFRGPSSTVHGVAANISSLWHHVIVTGDANINVTIVVPDQTNMGHATARLEIASMPARHTVAPRKLSGNGKVGTTTYKEVRKVLRKGYRSSCLSTPAPQFFAHSLNMLSKFVFIALLAAGCSAAPYPNEAAPYSWTVHKFNGTCSAATCWAWGFSISGSTGPSNQTAFIASDCNVDSRIQDHQVCNCVQVDVPSTVEVQIENASLFGGLLSVQYTFQQ